MNLKNIYYILISLLLLAGNLYAEENTLVTKLIVYDNQDTYHYMYIYNEKGHITVETKFKELSGETDLQNQSLTEWSYDNKDLCVSQIERHWDVDDWLNDNRVEYIYDNNNQLIREKYIRYTENGGEFNFRTIDYQYNSDGSLKTKTDSNFDSMENVSALTITSFLYDAALRLIEQLIHYQKEGEDYEDKISFIRADDGNLLSQLYQTKIDDAWVNLLKTDYIYQNDKLSMQKTQKWEDDKWGNNQRIIYEYNAAAKLQSEIYQFWNAQFWKDELSYLYKYNDSGYFLEKTSYIPLYEEWRKTMTITYDKFMYDKGTEITSQYNFWGGDDGSFAKNSIAFEFNDELRIKDAEKIVLSYQPIGNNDNKPTYDSKTENNKITIYPNPSKGIFYFNTNIYKVESWFVTDLGGKVFKKQQNDSESGVIDITGLPKGIYILHTVTAEGMLYQKLVKQ